MLIEQCVGAVLVDILLEGRQDIQIAVAILIKFLIELAHNGVADVDHLLT